MFFEVANVIAYFWSPAFEFVLAGRQNLWKSRTAQSNTYSRARGQVALQVDDIFILGLESGSIPTYDVPERCKNPTTFH